MARKKTIGILAAIVTADAAQLRNEFKSVDNTIRRSTTSWQKQLKGGLKLGASIVGAQAGLGALAGEIQHVIANVEKIPGIDPQAVASIVSARTEFAQLRGRIDGAIASVISFGIEAGKAIGAGAAMLMGADGDDVTAALSKQETPDEIASAKDQAYWDKVAAARERLVEANKKAARSSMTDSEQIADLRAEAERYDRFAQSASLNTLQRYEAKRQAADLTASAEQKLAAMKKELASAEQKLGAASFGAARAKTDDAQATGFLQDKTMQLQTELAELYRLMRENGESPEYLAAAIEKTNELTNANKQLEKVLDRQQKAAQEMGRELAGSFEQAVFSGGTLREMIRGIGQDILAIAFRNSITKPLGTALGNILSGQPMGKLGGIFSIFGFADGGRPPVGRPSLVGERGPELFVPDTAGTVVPNHKLGGGNGGNTYIIDARGADRTGLARLEAMIRALNGSIEQRALGAVLDHRRRGAFA